MSAFKKALAAFVCVGALLGAMAQYACAVNWSGTVSNDVNTGGVGGNWSDAPVPDNTTPANFVLSPSFNAPNLSADWNPQAIDFDGTIDATNFPTGYAITGNDGTTLTIGATNTNNTTNSGNLDSLNATSTVTVSVPHLVVTKNGYLSADKSDLHIESLDLKVGSFGNGTAAFTLYANSVGGGMGSLYITPEVSFASNTLNRPLDLKADAGRTINLAGGITGRSSSNLTAVNVNRVGATTTGTTGTAVIGGTSTNIAATTIYDGTLRVDGAYSGTTATMFAGTLQVNGTYEGRTPTGSSGTILFSGAGAKQVTGTGTITIGADDALIKWINMGTSSAPVTISTSNLVFRRGNSGIATGSNAAASLSITSSSLKMGIGTATSSKNFIETGANGGNITISPTVNLSEISVDQPLNVTAYENTTITLNNGITGHDSLTTNVIVNNDGINPGTVIIGGTSNFIGTTTVGNGTLLVNGTYTGTGLTTVNSGALLGGTGSIGGDVQIDGTLSPGASIGTLGAASATINAAYLLDTDLTGGSDLFNVGGTLTLGGSSSLDLVASSLDSASTYTIASYSMLSGTFLTIDPDILLTHSVDYVTGNKIRLVPGAAELPGDFNDDGAVDAADYVVWRKNDGANNPLPNSSPLGVPIGPAHYDLWRQNFGNPGPGSGSGLSSSTTVPEPSSLVLIGLAGAMLAMGRAGKGVFFRDYD